jgi:hypothetical protein
MHHTIIFRIENLNYENLMASIFHFAVIHYSLSKITSSSAN